MPYRRVVARFKVPETVGEHILQKRREDGLTQGELGKRLGVDGYTVMNWEKGHVKTIPATRMPAIIAYLGYNPEPKPEKIGAQLRWKRRLLGWTTAEAARQNSVDQSTWEQWEKQEGWPAYPRYRELVGEFLDLSAEKLIDLTRQVAKAAPRP